MLINGIEFPPDILKAINDNKLVIFAGAGVSIDPPSNLPDFNGLAKEIGRLCDKEFDPKKDEIDEFLGDLERENVKVKKYVAEVLSAQVSRPNSFHKNILKLFKTPEVVRIVTTNQDELFEAAARELGFSDVRTYSAPALPYGNDFSGIIHIHGKVSDPQHIIVTDTDFGNAYMLNGFATNFLVDLFKEYVVLFVGYSYNDRIVRYLTTAITSKNISNAFILSEDISSKLKRTRIEGIPFGKKNFKKECDALGIIGNYTKRGIFDWQQRISNLNLDSPPVDDETIDELLDGIRQLSVQKYFCSVIKGQDWPEWLDEHQVFETLFDEKADFTEQDSVWANWLATNYCDNKLPVLIARHGVNINKQFCYIILYQFQNLEERFSDALFCQYVSLLIDKIDEETEYYNIIQISDARKQDSVKWSVFWNMLKYKLILEKYSVFQNENQNYRIKHNWNSSDSLVRMVWENELSSQIIDARSTFLTCVKIIEDLYQRLSGWSFNKNTYVLDYLDIEKNEDSYHLYDVELVVCEIFEKAFQEINSVNPQLAFELMLDLLSSECALLRRMALLLIRLYCQHDADRIIDALLDHFTFYEHAEREQIFKLVAKNYDCISDEKRKQVIEKIWNVNVEDMYFKSNEEKERSIYYSRYNWLKWLESKSNHITEISDKLSMIYELFPDFMPRERPDLIMGPITTRWGSESPISKEELRSFSYKDACDYLISYKEDPSIMGPDRYGLMQTVSDLCKIDTIWGINIINELKTRDYWEEDLWNSIFRGLSKGIEKKKLFSRTLNCIDDNLIFNCGQAIASFIYDGINKESIFIEITEHLEKRLVKLVRKMWSFREVSKIDGISMIESSLNCTTGILTHILMRLTFLQPAERLIPSWLDSIVKREIEKSEYLDEYICTMCGYAAQLFYRNPDWTREHVLKYLDDNNSVYRKAAWEGFLKLVSNFYVEFGNEVLPYFKRNISFVFGLEANLRSRFIHDYSLLMVYITDDPTTIYLNELIKSADNSDRKRFAQSIATFLENMKSKERSDLWNRWLKKYWRNRNNNIPVELSSEEYDQMLLWLIGLPEYEEGVDIALESNVKFISANLFINKISDTEEPRHFPEKTALLIIHLFKHSDKNVRYTRMNGLINILKNLVNNKLRTELDEIMEYL